LIASGYGNSQVVFAGGYEAPGRVSNKSESKIIFYVVGQVIEFVISVMVTVSQGFFN
jgi:hypothetical protein